MPYQIKIFTADEVTDAERELAVTRFRQVLDESLGDESLVLPCYLAYLNLCQRHGDSLRPWPVSVAEQTLVDQWEAAELAATQATFGEHRYLGDADFEIHGPL